MIYFLTQDNCPKCVALKNYIEKALGTTYLNKISFIHRDHDSALFNELVSKFNIMATPCLIAGDDILRNPNLSNTRDFLDQH